MPDYNWSSSDTAIGSLDNVMAEVENAVRALKKRHQQQMYSCADHLSPPTSHPLQLWMLPMPVSSYLAFSIPEAYSLVAWGRTCHCQLLR